VRSLDPAVVPARRHYSSAAPKEDEPDLETQNKGMLSSEETEDGALDIGAFLSKPSWSVRSLLPSSPDASTPNVTRKQLHHLLRLSALPQPKNLEEENTMLRTLRSQLHFVKEIQSVDTTGVEPLVALRDETEEGIKEITIGLETLREAFSNEEIKGRNRRPKRRRDVKVEPPAEAKDWDVLGTATRTKGKYFVVNSGK